MKIGERQANAFGLVLAVDLSDAKRNRNRDRMDGQCRQQFLDELLPLHSSFCRIGTGGTMRQFYQSDNRECQRQTQALVAGVEQSAGTAKLGTRQLTRAAGVLRPTSGMLGAHSERKTYIYFISEENRSEDLPARAPLLCRGQFRKLLKTGDARDLKNSVVPNVPRMAEKTEAVRQMTCQRNGSTAQK